MSFNFFIKSDWIPALLLLILLLIAIANYIYKERLFQLVLGLFSLIRYLVGVLLATLFQLRKLHKSIVFVKITYLFAVSVFIFPLLIIIFYVNKYNLLFF